MADTPLAVVRRRASFTIYQGDWPMKITAASQAYEAALAAVTEANDDYDRAVSDHDDEGDEPTSAKRVGHKGTKSESRKRLDAARVARDKAKAEAEQRAAELDAVLEEAKGTGLTLVVQAFPRRHWRELKGKHLPRKDNELDEALGVNQDTLWNDVEALGPAEGRPPAVIEPEFTAESWLEFADDLSDADWTTLCSLIWDVNERSTQIPNFSAASDYRRRTESG